MRSTESGVEIEQLAALVANFAIFPQHMTKQRCDTRHRQTEDDGKSEEDDHENHCTGHD